ncbi:helix-turn-helix domain-containing protein [Metabacillus herbersteinensis]|uniref:Helix-turn-helix domain-containing protein n=1 Tax=Metabacillus herbersteinensis TaxID=283816 RepID=A0ABV6GFZ9_9BACI
MRELEIFKMNIKFYRERNGWSQEQLAERLTVSRPVITRLESGEQEPDLTYLISLSNEFNVSIDHLLGRDKVTSDLLYEVYGKYDTESNLSQIIDYLVKQPKILVSFDKLLEVKSKNRKHIEDMIVSVIDSSTKLTE